MSHISDEMPEGKREGPARAAAVALARARESRVVSHKSILSRRHEGMLLFRRFRDPSDSVAYYRLIANTVAILSKTNQIIECIQLSLASPHVKRRPPASQLL
jgi:hypothetical protein